MEKYSFKLTDFRTFDGFASKKDIEDFKNGDFKSRVVLVDYSGNVLGVVEREFVVADPEAYECFISYKWDKITDDLKSLLLKKTGRPIYYLEIEKNNADK